MQTQTPELEEGGVGGRRAGGGEAPPFTTMPDHPNTPGIFCSQLKPQTNIRLAEVMANTGRSRAEEGTGGGKEQSGGQRVASRAAIPGAGPAPS